MRPNATGVTHSVVYLCLFVLSACSLCLATSVNRAKTNEPIEMLFGGRDIWATLGRTVHTGATWRIRRNVPCLAAMRPYVTFIFANQQLNDCGAVVQAEAALCECGWQNAVADRLCDGDSSRLNTERCTVPCPGDCLLSDWSAWSSCSQTCSSPRAAAASAGYRTRFRQVLAVQTDPGNANPRHGTIRRDMLRC